MPKEFVCGFEILPHHHERAQLIYATAGTVRVSTEDGVWVVPPQRSVWVPGARRKVMQGRAVGTLAVVRHPAAVNSDGTALPEWVEVRAVLDDIPFSPVTP